jgi:GDP-L-fucose synthase
MREFLHVDDLADACAFLMDRYEADEHVNVGSGYDVSIRTLAETVRAAVHPTAELVFDTSKPDGMPRKLLDSSRLLGLGWRPRIELADGIASTYAWFLGQDEASLRLSTRA